MRITAMLGAGAALLIGGVADAQAPGAPFPPPAMGVNHPPLPPAPIQPVASRRWGNQVGGRWWGGADAPGGWAAYRRPYRGYRVPRYWVAPRFYVTDWGRYGLYAPTSGHNWVRYYDDAVLIDRDGDVSDWRGGLSWDREEYADDRGEGYGHGDDHIRRDDREGRDRRMGLPPRGDGHGEWRRDGDRDWSGAYPPLPPGHPPVGPSTWSDGRTTVTTTTSGYGYGGGAPVIVHGGGYGYGYGYAGGTTTVTIQSAPVVTTTTTTEIIEDTVTYRRPVVRPVVRHRAWRPRPACTCRPVRHHREPVVRGS